MTDFDLGNARGYIEIDPSGVKSGMDQARQSWDTGLSSMMSGVNQLGSSMQTLGVQMTALSAPFVAGMGLAVNAAVNFDESMTNTAAVLGLTRDEMAGLTEEIMAVGETSRAGPQAVADAFYDIVGGVADATTHMDILAASVATAEAGNADLAGVTSALISVMNSYGYEAEQAAFASDVLTATVGAGVGTMDQLAAALPQVAGLANSTGVSFGELGGAMALLSTKGNTFNQSATQLRAIMVAMLNPNEKMKKALADLGLASGEAAIEQYGLVGAIQRLSEESPTFQANMAGTLGSVEALNGAIALTSEGANDFLMDFRESMDGATEAAREIQNASPAAMLDFLRSKAAALKIEFGTALIPVLYELAQTFTPVIERVLEFVRNNGELVAKIGVVIGSLAVLGPAIAAVGTVLVTLTSPIGLVIGAIGALGMAWDRNLGGIRDKTIAVVNAVRHVLSIFIADVQNLGIAEAFDAIFGRGTSIEGMESSLEGALVSMGMGREQAIAIVDGIWNAIETVRRNVQWLLDTLRPLGTEIGKALSKVDLGQILKIGSTLLSLANPLGWIRLALEALGVDFKQVFEDIVQAATTFLSTLNSGGGFFDALRAAFGDTAFIDGLEAAFAGIVDFITNTVLPGLDRLRMWFVEEALPAVVQFVEGTVVPAIQGFFDFLGAAWEHVGPALEMIYNWFVGEALPAVVGFINNVVIPGIQIFINTLQNIWNAVAPTLAEMAKWFLETALPAILNFVTGTVIPFVEGFIQVLQNIWLAVEPVIVGLLDWFLTNGWPVIQGIIETAGGIIQGFIDILSDIWRVVEPFVNGLLDWFQTNGWPIIEGILNTGKNLVQGFIDVLVGIWSVVEGPLNALKDGIGVVFNFIKDNIIQPVIDVIGGVVTAVQGALEWLGILKTDMTNVDQIKQDTLGSGGINYGGVDAGRGFAMGGFTGFGAPSALAGMVHHREYVIPAQGVPVIRESGPREPMMNFEPGAITINANGYEQGAAAAKGFEDRIAEFMRSRG